MHVQTSSRRAIFGLMAVILTGALLFGGCGRNGESCDKPNANHVRKPVTMEKLDYPVTAAVDQVDTYHGTDIADPYRWLEDVDSEETHAWVKAQNKVTFDFLEKLPSRQAYKNRLTELWDYERYGTPYKKSGRTFFRKNDGLQNQSVLYVQDSDDGEPRVLLDPNNLSEDGTVALGSTSVSDDGRYMAYAISASGSDWQTWYVRDIATGKDLDDEIKWCKWSGAAWLPDGSGFFYSRYDAPTEGETYEGANYYHKLYYHQRGTDQDADKLVYESPDNKEWGFGGNVSEDGRYLLINVWQGTSRNNRLYYQDLLEGDGTVRKLLDDYDASYVFLGNDGPVFFIQTNLDAPRERVVAIDTQHPQKSGWKTLIPESADPIDDVSLLNRSFVVTYMHDVANVVKIFDLDGRHLKDVELPGLGGVGGFYGKFEDAETYYAFTSFLNPNEIYHYDFATGRSTLFRAPQIKFDFSGYTTEQVFYESKDGTKIPMFVVHAKDLKMDGSNPTFLYGYGGFNVSLNPRFRTSILPWLEKGGVFAVANLRGGGEYGEAWHEAGMLKNKQNVFDDFIAAAEYLICEGYTNPNKLAVSGASNGGTLVGAVINQRPELFGAALPGVGVMDMLRFQLFTIGWAWVSDYGSSEDPEMFPVLHAYSPYHNLKKGTAYPAVMVTTADHDDRVVPGHSFKYAAMLQACHAGNLPVLIRIEEKAGHGAGTPTTKVIEEKADEYAFLSHVLGMED